VDKRSRERDESADDDALDDALEADDAPAPGQSRDDTPDSATDDPIERRRFGPVGAVPSSRRVTVALCVVFVVLLGYAIWTGNVVSVVGMVVIIVFVGLPLLVLTIVNHGRFLPPAPSPYADPAKDGLYGHDGAGNEPDEREPLDGQYPAQLLDEPPGEDGKRHGLN
jgi:hypothetical protein